ncbi:MAG: hypothetical protein DRO39_06260 [Thermoprotei archaeon]|nr:MAG: hypothetical protein DRO39_06260 [Thermoprotei archaeon]
MTGFELSYTRYILRAVERQVLGCIDEGLICLDPPAVTTAILRKRLGLSESTIRSFWRFVRNHSFTADEMLIYKFAEAKVGIEMNVVQGTAYSIDGVFVDSIDCKLHPRRCVEIPNANMLYIYVVASAEGSIARVNAVYLLKKLTQAEGARVLRAIEDLALALAGHKIDEGALDSVSYIVSVVHKYKKYTRDIFIKVPESLEELKKFSPLVRRFLRLLRR